MVEYVMVACVMVEYVMVACVMVEYVMVACDCGMCDGCDHVHM